MSQLQVTTEDNIEGNIGDVVGKNGDTGLPVFAEFNRDELGYVRTIYALRLLMLNTESAGGNKISISTLKGLLNKDPLEFDLKNDFTVIRGTDLKVFGR
jgi:hypothetical protein